MSRRGTRRAARSLLPWLVALALVLVFAGCTTRATPTQAPDVTQATAPAASTAAAPAASAAITGTTAAGAAGTPAAATGTASAPAARTGTAVAPSATITPTLTPSPTATFTELQARLVLAKAYLEGKDYDSAATLYSQIAEDTRGNAEALQGLQAALGGKAAIQATQLAPLPTETPAPAETPVPAATLASATGPKVLDAFGFVVAGLVLIALLYLLGALLRWLLGALRELWYTRILPLLGRPAVPPGFLIGEFTSPFTTEADTATRVIPVSITEKLTQWNHLVRDKQFPIELEREAYGGPLAWLRVLWAWVLPPPRGYRLTGAILEGPGGIHQLAVQRTHLGQHRVDRSHIFESDMEPAAEAYRAMAAETGKWLLVPADIDADRALAAVRKPEQGPSSASATFDAAIETLLPVRQQVTQGLVDFPDARRRMREAEQLIASLPTESELRAELTRVFADLRRAVPGG